ncbi:glycosyltransferase family 2 protein [Stieleria varia]|uniref:Undecaprenyl-phosphate 4-deoxy-4-formamido-L-arabinose transferase n=1 Tax=Stieleria varia TaxID=2528005 RepID=A0A5C6AR60_9BACT|nr:glycosyltransferase family 2 protein [Stieleria varia]TWU02523.1 Undecaprenyl-phosphate 4-deoxy-4-formamido-L-arabinose transferase [Stieleria varia]
MSNAAHYWSRDYVAQMQALLGPDACRKLAIYELPDSFLLSVIVPVYNERDTVAGVVERLASTGIPMQVILVDDGSQDGTGDVLEGLADGQGVLACRHERNLGKGAAIRTALGSVKGDLVVIQDADREYDPSDFRYLIQPLLSGEADVAYGTRYGHYDRQLSPWWHQAVNGLITWLASIAIGIRLSDVETCYKMVPREHLAAIESDLRENRFGIEIELTARLARRGLRFTERPIRYQHRWYGEGKKIGWKDGVGALWCILKYGLLRR